MNTDQNKTVMDVDYFINKFEAIPEEKWCTRAYFNGYGACCALGHTLEKGISFGDEYNAIINVFDEIQVDPIEWYPSTFYSSHVKIAAINNCDAMQYQQSTPKKRILAALYDIKAKEIEISEVHQALNRKEVNHEHDYQR